MQTFQLGDTRITRVEELIGPLFDPITFFPTFHQGLVDAHKDWLFPNHMDAKTGRIIASMHSWLIQTPHHNILIDACIGNHKDRNPYRAWHQMKTDWATRLKATGVDPTQIDYVLCTHLHVDHVGWNTQLIDGTWQPTFPNARYVFSKTELEHVEAALQTADPKNDFALVNQKTYQDSIKPILPQTDLVIDEMDLISDRLSIALTPGHTPGSITLGLTSGDKHARFCGDICHHPLQIYEPTMNSAFCEMPEQAIETRINLLEDCAENNLLLMPAHFGPSHAGWVRREADAYAFKWC